MGLAAPALLAAMACGDGAGGNGGVPVDGEAAAAAVEDTQSAPASAPGARRAVVFFGTSLTAGLGVDIDDAYPALVASRIDSAGLPFDVVNAGSSGETSAGALRRIEWVITQRPVDVLVLETGANDGLRGLAIDSTRANIQAIITHVRRERPEAALLLVQMEAPPNLGEDYTRRFRAMFSSLAAEYRIALVPFLLEGVAGVDTLNQGDGIHPNVLGHRVIAGTVWEALEPVLRGRERRGDR